MSFFSQPDEDNDDDEVCCCILVCFCFICLLFNMTLFAFLCFRLVAVLYACHRHRALFGCPWLFHSFGSSLSMLFHLFACSLNRPPLSQLPTIFLAISARPLLSMSWQEDTRRRRRSRRRTKKSLGFAWSYQFLIVSPWNSWNEKGWTKKSEKAIDS